MFSHPVYLFLREFSLQDSRGGSLEAAGCWRRASDRWLFVMGNVECTEAQREWLLLRRNYCLAQISSPPLPETLDISEVAKAADATLRRMGIATPSGEVFRKGTPVC
ncbi:PerC family transcriptional regulator [Escherichia coli]|nr:PerC family transcriptional regulator [Escherichia coli]